MNQQSRSDTDPEDAERKVSDRRPLASRNTAMAQRLSRYLASTSLTPNQISGGSIVFAGIACLFFVLSGVYTEGAYVVCMLLVIAGCQLRLLCNLMDGMVAIEAGKQTPDGAVWNEFPDRIADMLIIAGLGVASGWSVLGWVAVALAVLVAYVRELGKGIDGVVDFSGPMAKPHRMALVSAGALLSGIAELLSGVTSSDDLSSYVLQGVLVLLVAGSIATIWRRVHSILVRLTE